MGLGVGLDRRQEGEEDKKEGRDGTGNRKETQKKNVGCEVW